MNIKKIYWKRASSLPENEVSPLGNGYFVMQTFLLSDSDK